MNRGRASLVLVSRHTRVARPCPRPARKPHGDR